MPRSQPRRLGLVASLCACAAALLAAGSAVGSKAATATPARPLVARPVDASHAFGMQYVPKFDERQRKGAWEGSRMRGLAMHRDLGVQVSREGFIWRRFSPDGPGPGRQVADFDDVVERLSGAGIAAQAMVTETPYWASTAADADAKDPQTYKFAPPRGLALPIFDDGTDTPGPGKHLNARNTWAMGLGDMVGRYRGKVRYWQVWNEPDYPDGALGVAAAGDRRRSWTGSVDDYVRLLKVGHVVVKWLDPQALVVTGGLGHAEYLEAMLDRGAGASFDLIDFHAYGWPGSDTALAEYVRVHDTLAAVLAKHGLGARGLICSETGYTADQPATQAAYIAKLYPTAIAMGVETTMYYANVNPSWKQMGLIDWRTMSQRTAGYWAYKHAAESLRDARSVTPLSLSGVTGFRFERRTGGPVWVVWAPGSKASRQLELPVGLGRWRVYDALGHLTATSNLPSINLTVGESPLWVDGDLRRAYVEPKANPPLARAGLAFAASVADSSADGQGGPGAAIDTDPDTHWVSGGFQKADASLTLSLAKPTAIKRLRLKTGPTPPGTWFDVEASSDGHIYAPVATGLTVASWHMEEVALAGGVRASHLRLRWHNPEKKPVHFSVFEVEAY